VGRESTELSVSGAPNAAEDRFNLRSLCDVSDTWFTFRRVTTSAGPNPRFGWIEAHFIELDAMTGKRSTSKGTTADSGFERLFRMKKTTPARGANWGRHSSDAWGKTSGSASPSAAQAIGSESQHGIEQCLKSPHERW
jgi:hypothetical protein